MELNLKTVGLVLWIAFTIGFAIDMWIGIFADYDIEVNENDEHQNVEDMRG